MRRKENTLLTVLLFLLSFSVFCPSLSTDEWTDERQKETKKQRMSSLLIFFVACIFPCFSLWEVSCFRSCDRDQNQFHPRQQRCRNGWREQNGAKMKKKNKQFNSLLFSLVTHTRIRFVRDNTARHSSCGWRKRRW